MVAKPPSAAATRHYRVLPGAPSSGAAWLVSDEPGAPMIGAERGRDAELRAQVRIQSEDDRLEPLHACFQDLARRLAHLRVELELLVLELEPFPDEHQRDRKAEDGEDRDDRYEYLHHLGVHGP